MSDDSTKNETESLFLREMADVTPLKPDNRIRSLDKANKTGRTSRRDKAGLAPDTQGEYRTTIDDVFSDQPVIGDCPDILSFSRSGLQHNVLKKLRAGRFPVEQVLDLHGLTVQEARKELLDFLSECEVAGIRNVIIVHGKGFRSKNKPVIKPMLNRWLRATDTVLAFHSAQPKDGGSGALYVLLRKQQV